LEKKKKEKTKNRKIVGFSLLWVVWACAWVVSLLQVCFFIAGEQCSPLRILSPGYVGASIARPRGVVGAAPYKFFRYLSVAL